jgi:hypothetical protein
MGILGSSAHGLESKRSSGFWGQDIGWDCCHEISAKDGEGIEEVFRVIARKLVEQKNKSLETADTTQAGGSTAVKGAIPLARRRRREPLQTESTGTDGTFGASNADKRRSWLTFPPALMLTDEQEEDEEPADSKQPRQGRCC